MPILKELSELIPLLKKVDVYLSTVFGGINHPFLIAVPVIFFGFLIWRRFNTSEYVTAGKEAMNHIKMENDILRRDYDQLKSDYSTLSAELKIVSEELEQCGNTLRKIKADFDEFKKVSTDGLL